MPVQRLEGTAETQKGRRLLLTAAWLLLAAAGLYWWEVTLRFPRLLVWTLVFLVAFLAAARVVDPRGAWRPGGFARRRAVLWAISIVVTAVGLTLVPTVRLAGETLGTAPVGGALDVALPAWILGAGVFSLWGGTGRLAVAAVGIVLLAVGTWAFVIRMPGASFRGRLDPLTPDDEALRSRLEDHVRVLSETIGERSADRYDATLAAAEYVEATLAAMGFRVARHAFTPTDRTYANLEVTIAGARDPDRIVIVGAHYDTAHDTPGADDNASGVAGALELARTFAGTRPARTLRFVFFASEEPPYFATAWMGSEQYARRAEARGERIVGMLSLESIGYFATEPGSQRYPPPFSFVYPDRGDFIGFVGNLSSGWLVRRAIRAFRSAARFPSEGAAAPTWLPGITWSDQLAFWQHGYPAIMVTGTAPFRNPFYHTPDDTMDRLDFPRLTRVVRGLEAVVQDLVEH